MADVKIVMTGHDRGEVFVDGHKIEGVRRIEFSASARLETNVLTLEMISKRVEIEGPADVAVPLTPSEKFSDDYKRWLFLPWWRRMFGSSPFDQAPPASTRTNIRPAGSVRPPPPPSPPPPRDVRGRRR